MDSRCCVFSHHHCLFLTFLSSRFLRRCKRFWMKSNRKLQSIITCLCSIFLKLCNKSVVFMSRQQVNDHKPPPPPSRSPEKSSTSIKFGGGAVKTRYLSLYLFFFCWGIFLYRSVIVRRIYKGWRRRSTNTSEKLCRILFKTIKN